MQRRPGGSVRRPAGEAPCRDQDCDGEALCGDWLWRLRAETGRGALCRDRPRRLCAETGPGLCTEPAGGNSDVIYVKNQHKLGSGIGQSLGRILNDSYLTITLRHRLEYMDVIYVKNQHKLGSGIGQSLDLILLAENMPTNWFLACQDRLNPLHCTHNTQSVSRATPAISPCTLRFDR